MTIVVDLETGRIVYVGEGKGADALDGLWPKLKRAGCRIEAVSSDLSEAFISAVKEHLPDAVQVYDHFHIVKLMNEKLDILNWLYENGFLVIGAQTLDTVAELYTVEELRELLKKFAEM